MITFDTQADFDEAVIDAIAKLLEMRVSLDRFGDMDGPKISVRVDLVRSDDVGKSVIGDGDEVQL